MTRQPFLPELCPIEAATAQMSVGTNDDRGAIFTRREVANFILDLCGYKVGKSLYERSLLEPSFGAGDFLIPAVERLLIDWQTNALSLPARELCRCIRGVELHAASVEQTRAALFDLLAQHNIDAVDASALVTSWLRQGDFLMVELDQEFDYVIGNPPYVRPERVPDALMREYRDRYSTMFDRADIYVGFFERSLQVLAPNGKLGFICADRWMKNRYGEPLRKLISSKFHLAVYVDMYGVDAFHADVVAYPAITIVERTSGSETRIAFRPEIRSEVLDNLAAQLTSELPIATSNVYARVTPIDGAPWLFDASGVIDIVRSIEARFPTLEEAGCQVGIGVATGADQIFIGDYEHLDVEADRKLPLVMTKDIRSGQLQWQGKGVINPFRDEGGLVDLAQYPRLRAYLSSHEAGLKARHVARKSAASWYRTIDRIYPELTGKPKLLIPDIKGAAHVVLDDGNYYPHHNLYYVTSSAWDLRALRVVLRSPITFAFITSYATKMRGGYLRFQAQYLRRLRLPQWDTIAPVEQAELIALDATGDSEACATAVARLYGLTDEEAAMLRG